MKILALELSTAVGSLAWRDAEVECVRDWPNDRKDSAAFFKNLQVVRRQFGAPETMIVGLGPGSYAGTRIAISAAIGMQLSSHARLIGWPSICAMECSAEEYCVIGDARRNSFFFARVRKNALIEGPNLFSGPDLKPKLKSFGSDMPVFSSEILAQCDRPILRFPSALVLARLAGEPGHGFFLPPLEPIYMRAPHITMPATGT